MDKDFSTKYTDANIAQDAAQYESGQFLRLQNRMAKLLHSDDLATALIVRKSHPILLNDHLADVFSRPGSDADRARARRHCGAII